MRKLVLASALALMACPTVKPLDCTRDRDCYRDEFCNLSTKQCELRVDAGVQFDAGVPDSGVPDAGSPDSFWDESSWDEKHWTQ